MSLSFQVLIWKIFIYQRFEGCWVILSNIEDPIVLDPRNKDLGARLTNLESYLC